MGGAWERIIRTIRKILNALIGYQILNDEGLVTFTIEVAAILNSRPLVPVMYHDNLSPGLFDKHCYTRKSWAQIQYMSNQLVSLDKGIYT